jgi:hypothetical protein
VSSYSLWSFKSSLAQAARIATAVSIASDTSALPKVFEPYSIAAKSVESFQFLLPRLSRQRIGVLGEGLVGSGPTSDPMSGHEQGGGN